MVDRHNGAAGRHVRGRCCARSTAAKYSSGAVLRRYTGSPGASLTCSTPFDGNLARGSGRRGRRFKSCHPDHRHRSPTCANAALRWLAFHSGPPAVAPKEQKRNTRAPQGKPGPTSTGTRPPRTAQQTPRHSRDPQGTLIPRPQRRGRLVGKMVTCHVRLGTNCLASRSCSTRSSALRFRLRFPRAQVRCSGRRFRQRIERTWRQ